MSTYLEVWTSGTSAMVPLEGFRLTLGRADDNDVVIGDRRVSAVHLVFECIGPHWSVRDVGSRNGTVLNGERLLVERVLRSGDEIRVGGSRLVYRSPAPPVSPTTDGTTGAPRLTRREKDVLIALCRPLAEGSFLTEPASVAAMAAELMLSVSAVKKHIANLYDKFGLYDDDRRRGRLANEAIARGAVSVAELRSPA